jgi:predicted PhzF superfamily epimerase YddE/YHI9
MSAFLPSAAPTVLRYAAFADPANIAADASANATTNAGAGGSTVGGNPAGIVLDAAGLTDADMQRIAAEVGYAETAFVIDSGADHQVVGNETDSNRFTLRYFSPIAEVPFCGHATVATAVALAERTSTSTSTSTSTNTNTNTNQGTATSDDAATFTFDTSVGEVTITTTRTTNGITAAFTSVQPEVRPIDPAVLRHLLSLLGLTETDLDARYPVRLSYAGNWHPIVVLRDPAVFDTFRFDPTAMRTLMDAEGYTGTVSILLATSPTEFEARNLFPVGAITEDPATGSAAASLGGYLRSLGSVDDAAPVIIHQGRHVGSPSLLTIHIPKSGGIVVSGTAVPIKHSIATDGGCA